MTLIVIAMGCTRLQFPSLNETIAAVTSRVRSTAPHVGLLTFSSMAGVILERDCTASENAALAELVTYWHARNVQILSDQHIPSQSFGGVLQTIWNMTTMVEVCRRNTFFRFRIFLLVMCQDRPQTEIGSFQSTEGGLLSLRICVW
jgi:hypothetical protein|eukprot:COSAG06_NODE_181_length_20926_cov_7.590051_27_plen_146_part_00